MPLPPLPDNNTDVAWLAYTSAGVQHELQFRVPSVTAQATIITMATAMANAWKVFLATTDSFNGLRHRDSGSTVSFPLAWTSVAGTGSASDDGDDKPAFMSIVGRSLAGYRCKLTLFTTIQTDASGYRLARLSGNAADILLDAVDALTPKLVAVDGQEVIWNQYMNRGYNAYWQRKQR